MLIDIAKPGSTAYSCSVRVVNSTTGIPEAPAWNTAGAAFWYRRPGAAQTAIALVTQTETGAHVAGGFVHISDGYCRLDLPDAAIADGAKYVDVGGIFTDMIVIGGRIKLGVPLANEDHTISGLNISTNGLQVTHNDGDAVSFVSSGGNGDALVLTANGSGQGMNIDSDTGSGIHVATAGVAILATSTGADGVQFNGGVNSDGLQVQGNGSGHGLRAQSTGDGSGAFLYGSGNGPGATLNSLNGNGMDYKGVELTAAITDNWKTQSQATPADFQVNQIQINSDAVASSNLAAGAKQLRPFVVGASASATSIPTDITGAPYTTTDHFKDRVVTINNETKSILGSSGSPVILTVSDFVSVPNQNDEGVIS